MRRLHLQKRFTRERDAIGVALPPIRRGRADHARSVVFAILSGLQRQRAIDDHEELDERCAGWNGRRQAKDLLGIPARIRQPDPARLQHAQLRRRRTQLRRISIVRNDTTGERMYFRFYDPQMLRLFLPTCTPRQKEQIFGEIEVFLVAGRDGEPMRLTARGAPEPLTVHAPPCGLEMET